MGVDVAYISAQGKILSGGYTLSTGITPSIIQIETTPLDGINLEPVAPLIFSDGTNTFILPECRLVDVQIRKSDNGATWLLQFEDQRWKWAYGWISGEYNKDVIPGQLPAEGTAERDSLASANSLAEFILRMMEVGSYDISLLPDDDYPYVKWDYSNPAEELAKLAERYGLAVCYDPLTPKVTLVKPGVGAMLSLALPYISLDKAQANLKKPEKLLAVCERIAYEWEFELEAVGIETDGSLEPIDSLSYKPAGGWGAQITRGSFDDITDEEDKRDAERSVFRWYRVKPRLMLTGNAKTKWKPASLSEMLPLSRKLVTTAVETDFNGEKRIVNREAYVYGTFADSDKEAMNRANLTDKKVKTNFNCDEKRGLVKFSAPVYKFDGSSNVVAADLKLRCVVYGKRLTVEKNIGGPFGTLVIPCDNLQPYENMQDFFGATTPPYGGNIGQIEAEAKKILDLKAATFENSETSTARYVGIYDIKLDGKIEQVTWEVGAEGAFTTASLNTEHAFHLPSAEERRQLERSRPAVVDSMKEIAAEPSVDGAIPKALSFEPRAIKIYNNSGMEIPAFGLVEITAAGANGYFTVVRPTDDYISVAKVLVNGSQPIAAGCYGLAQASDAFMFLATGSPALADEFGTTADSFNGQISTEEGTGGILVCGATSGVSGVALGRFF